MKSKPRMTSIIGRLAQTTRTTAVMLLVPVLVSLTMMFLTTIRYQRSMSRMETAANLKPIVATQLPEQLFSVAAGRIRYEDSGVEKCLRSVNRTLEGLLEETEGDGYLELTVARRTMDTLAGFTPASSSTFSAPSVISSLWEYTTSMPSGPYFSSR